MLGHMSYLLGYKVGASPFPKHLQESGCRGNPKSCIQINIWSISRDFGVYCIFVKSLYKHAHTAIE